MMSCLRLVLLVFLIGLPMAVKAQVASQPVATGHAQTQLVAEMAGVAPGGTITLGLAQVLQDHWHVYWSNPGDSGLPLRLSWTLPDGWRVGDIRYPTPQSISLPPLMNFGHEGAPVFTVDLTAPDNAEIGTAVPLKVRADWLICDDVCVPEFAQLDLEMPIVRGSAPPDSLGAPLIAGARNRQPMDLPVPARSFDMQGMPVLSLAFDSVPEGAPFFFPYVEGLIEPAGDITVQTSHAGLQLAFVPSFQYDPATLTALDGVLTFTKTGAKLPHAAYRIAAPFGPAPAGGSAASPAPLKASQSGLAILGFAFLGGVILNVMPCVFPIIFLKASSLAQVASHGDLVTARRHGLLYTAGVVLSFLAIAGLLLALRAGGQQLGWGFQLQHPLPVSVFAFVMLLIGLNLAGVFEIGTSLQGVGSPLASKRGDAGAFFTGLLAVAVAAPCVGPFLGGALSFGLTAPGVLGLGVFAVMGLGLALPYLLISFIPSIARILPRPGPWMETFKQLLAFPMFATCIWLIWTLTRMSGTGGLAVLLAAMLVVGFAAWLYGRGQGAVSKMAAAGAVLAAGLAVSTITIAPVATVAVNAPGSGDVSKLPSDVFSSDRLAALREAGTPVFVDFTAAWCVTCQSNKITAIKRARVIQAFHETGTVYMVADWTVQDDAITQALAQFGRTGVPLYLYYSPGAQKPVILPQILTPDLMLKTLTNA